MKKPPLKQTILSASLATIFAKQGESAQQQAKTARISLLNFECSPEDRLIITDIATRAVAMARVYGVTADHMLCAMDVTAVHCNGQPLKLLQLLLSDDNDFSHDITLIDRALDRKTGKMHSDAKLRFALNNS